MSKEHTLVKKEPQYEVVITQISRWKVFGRYTIGIYKDYSLCMPYIVTDTLWGAKRKALKLVEKDKNYPKEVARFKL